MAVDLTLQIQGFFDGPVDHLFALPILASTSRTALTANASRLSHPTQVECELQNGGRMF